MGKNRRPRPLDDTSSSRGAPRARDLDPRASVTNEEAHIAKAAAEQGAASAGSDLPFLSQLQASFGEYDLSGMSAHQDREAAGELRSEAYTIGRHVVFGRQPDLHLAAEEATHSILQQAGKGPDSGVGREGDRFENHARQVADLAVSGKDVAPLLDRMTGGAHRVGRGAERRQVQRRAATNPLPEKTVSPEAMQRLIMAREAMAHAKKVFHRGAGNQKQELEDSDFNTYHRMQATRDDDLFNHTQETADLANSNWTAYTAAKSALTGGGNCGEHAAVVFEYLRKNYPDVYIQMSATEDLDHAYVVIGDPSKLSDEELVVADAWPTEPTATLWEDHFAYTDDRSKLQNLDSSQGDDTDYVQYFLDNGLSLTDEGRAMTQSTESSAEVERQIREGTGGWIWDHGDAAAQGQKYNYVTAKQPGSTP